MPTLLPKNPFSFLAALLTEIGSLVLFALNVFSLFIRRGVRVRSVLHQMYAVGVKSIPATAVIGLFVGAIMAVQMNLQLRDFGAQSFLGGLSTSTTIRNIGPVLIAFLLSGKVGAYTSAELGMMQVTEQINALRCLGINPIQFLILPRMLAVIFSSFLLLVIGLMLAVLGGVFISSVSLGVNALSYIENIPRLVTWWSVGVGVTKSFVFGVLIAVICCFKGYTAKGGALGVGEAVRSSAVATLVSIIIVDFCLSVFSNFLQDFFLVGQL